MYFVEFLLSDYFCFVASFFFVTCILYVQPLFIEGEEAKGGRLVEKQKKASFVCQILRVGVKTCYQSRHEFAYFGSAAKIL